MSTNKLQRGWSTPDFGGAVLGLAIDGTREGRWTTTPAGSPCSGTSSRSPVLLHMEYYFFSKSFRNHAMDNSLCQNLAVRTVPT